MQISAFKFDWGPTELFMTLWCPYDSRIMADESFCWSFLVCFLPWEEVGKFLEFAINLDNLEHEIINNTHPNTFESSVLWWIYSLKVASNRKDWIRINLQGLMFMHFLHNIRKFFACRTLFSDANVSVQE